MQKTIHYQRTKNDEELKEILVLQEKSSPQNISPLEKKEEGFVTVQHSLTLLKKMHDACPHIVAKHHEKVIGYALCMLPKFKKEVPVLIPMFHEIDNELLLKKEPINYLVMGQICIDKTYRKQGVFRGLYHFMKQEVHNSFNAIITEVDVKNVRSSNAHKAIGFKELKTYTSNGQEWELILLEV
ncbi:MAG: GNAT family N-acetyltransferase [Polaribacter sp.]|nr:GNAT family N-acetyltransferase [Polaribacter sp.]